VAAIDWAMCQHSIRHHFHVSYANSSTRLPTNTCHMSYGPCHVLYGPATSTSVRTVQSTHFFCLFVDLNRTISLSSDVHLNPNKLCWVRDDEAYAPVRFEAILSTLNFEQNLIPWITPPHWKAFGPPKDYF
jgi:hypothetical protein